MNTLLRFTATSGPVEAEVNRVDTFGTVLTPGRPANVYNGTYAVDRG